MICIIVRIIFKFLEFPYTSKIHLPKQFQPDDADQNQERKEHSQKRSGVAKERDAYGERSDGTDARPDNVCRANGNAALRQIKEQAAQRHANNRQTNKRRKMVRVKSGQFKA